MRRLLRSFFPWIGAKLFIVALLVVVECAAILPLLWLLNDAWKPLDGGWK
jgi:hypothetical protein